MTNLPDFSQQDHDNLTAAKLASLLKRSRGPVFIEVPFTPDATMTVKVEKRSFIATLTETHPANFEDIRFYAAEYGDGRGFWIPLPGTKGPEDD